MKHRSGPGRWPPSTSVLSDQTAEEGGVALNGFLNGIDASRDPQQPPPHLTALGHSYGSLTTGIALQQPTPVDDAVVFGSPGLDAEERSDLKVPPGHLYAERGVLDPIAVPVFGTSPYRTLPWEPALEDVDELGTGNAVDPDGKPLNRTYSHSGYLDEGNTSQYNMAAIVAGHPELTIHD